MPFIGLPIHRGTSFTGRKHDFSADVLSSPSTQVWFKILRRYPCRSTTFDLLPFFVLFSAYVVRPCIQTQLHDLQVQELDARKSWAAIGEARSSSEDDKNDRIHHNSGGVDTSIHMLREKNRCASCQQHLPSQGSSA